MPRHSRTCHSAELLQCRSQIRDKLDSNKQRQSKWTTDAELAVLTTLWGCMARRVDRCFDFTYRSLQKGKPADVYFSAKAVKRKLAELKAVLPPEVYDFPAHTPADEMAVMLPPYEQLADANGRQQVSNGATSTLGLGLELGSCSSTYVKATSVGQAELRRQDKTINRPSPGFDSVTGWAGPTQVFMVYELNRACPTHLVTYEVDKR